jgi:hypothetical protein
MKLKIVMPHKKYPVIIKIFLFPILSDKAPINNVVRVAVTADKLTIKAIDDGEALN